MGRKKGEELPVGDLRGRIEAWRKCRVGRRRMPEELWAEAVDWAQRFGACRVSRALGIGYQGLRVRLAKNGQVIVGGTEALGDGFVELEPMWAGSGPSLVEVMGQQGCRLTLRILPGCGIDVAGVVAAFFGHTG